MSGPNILTPRKLAAALRPTPAPRKRGRPTNAVLRSKLDAHAEQMRRSVTGSGVRRQAEAAERLQGAA